MYRNPQTRRRSTQAAWQAVMQANIIFAFAYPATRESANRSDIRITIDSRDKNQSVGKQTAHREPP